MPGQPGAARSHGAAASRADRVAQRVARRNGGSRAASGGADTRRKGPGFFSVILSLIIVLIEIIVILGGVGFWLGSMAMVGVLNEIRQHDFSAPMERVESYQSFFGALRKAGYAVVEGKPKILAGKTTYLWTVSPRRSAALCTFQWTHDLQSNEIVPQTNAALLLDVKLGNIKLQQLADYSFYDAYDIVARAIVEGNTALLKPGEQLGQIQDQPLPETGVMAPLVTPEEGKARARHGKPAEAPTDETQPGQEGQGGETPAGDGGDGGGAIEVTPPDGNGGGGGETPPGDGGGGGGETPPGGGGGE